MLYVAKFQQQPGKHKNPCLFETKLSVRALSDLPQKNSSEWQCRDVNTHYKNCLVAPQIADII